MTKRYVEHLTEKRVKDIAAGAAGVFFDTESYSVKSEGKLEILYGRYYGFTVIVKVSKTAGNENICEAKGAIERSLNRICPGVLVFLTGCACN